MAQHAINASTPVATGSHQSAPIISDKLYFRIGEVAQLCEVPAYVLRFWESEFPQLKPNKGGTGQRLYRRRDVEMALRIKALLYDEGFTIPGARQALKSERQQKDPQLSLSIKPDSRGAESVAASATSPKALRKLQQEMQELLRLLSERPEGKRSRSKHLSHSMQPTRAAALETKDLFS